jgi:nucleoside-diphosphate kinase
MAKSMKERTLILFKPDAVQRAVVGEILMRFEKVGLKIIALKMAYPDEKLASSHYPADESWMNMVGEKQKRSYEAKGIKITEDNIEIGRRVHSYLLSYLTMSPIIAVVLEGHNAVAQVRKMVGSTNPGDALPGTIRGDYTIDTYNLSDNSKRPIQNLIHASGTVQEAEREIKIWFIDEEIHDWKRVDEDLIYREGN